MEEIGKNDSSIEHEEEEDKVEGESVIIDAKGREILVKKIITEKPVGFDIVDEDGNEHFIPMSVNKYTILLDGLPKSVKIVGMPESITYELIEMLIKQREKKALSSNLNELSGDLNQVIEQQRGSISRGTNH